jgi:hypothetical protein
MWEPVLPALGRIFRLVQSKKVRAVEKSALQHCVHGNRKLIQSFNTLCSDSNFMKTLKSLPVIINVK